jgi:hypothetical protein
VAVHLCRDYNTQYVGSNRGSIPGYLIPIFLRRVLGYSYVGDTNLNINSVGPLLIATGDSTPTGAPTWVTANKAGINNGAGTYHVTIPVAIRTVVSGDIGRILALKSTANPTFNSGLFLITAIDTPNNAYVIDWRSGDTPPAETQAIFWYLYEKDSSTPTPGTNNGSGGYEGNGTSTTPRVILQSPHATAWQVRICIESVSQATNASFPLVTVAPGFGGNASGDFPVGGRHLHGNLWYNQPPAGNTANPYFGMTTGPAGDLSGASGSIVFRCYMVGDDTGQACGWIAYSPNTGQPNNVHWGICDNEPTPLPIDPLLRLFVIGPGYASSFGGIRVTAGQPNASACLSAGAAFGYGGSLITATPSCWTFASEEQGGFQNSGPFVDATRLPGDSPWTGSTDLLTVEIIGGALWNWQSNTVTQFVEPRTMGTLPFIRQGRSNFGNFQTTSDAGHAWMHTQNSVFLLYGGPANIP